MLPFFGVFIVFTFLLTAGTPHPATLRDDAHIKIESLHDAQGLLAGYEAYIRTPVCETENCYIVEINFTWDLIGRFQRFDTLADAGLTKLDHIPFTKKDYQKLDQLLKDTNSPLAHYRKEDLVRDTRNSAIDGFTGATALEIKKSVISGGVYSCYTLWHLAHGALVDSLQRRTYYQLDTALANKIVQAKDQEMNYFLIHYFSEQDYAKYLPQVLKTIEDGDGYYAKQTIERMPQKVLTTPVAQDFFARQFDFLNYFTQVALLKRLTPQTVSPTMIETLQKQLETRNSRKNQLIQELLESKH